MTENSEALEAVRRLCDADRAHLFHPLTHTSDHANARSSTRIMTGGEGVYVSDAEGRRFIDGFAGLYCVNVGYGRREIVDAIAEQGKHLAYYHAYAGHSTETAVRLAERIARSAPGRMRKVFFGLSGSDANETQVKLIWYYNNVRGRSTKKKLIARRRAYHGCSVMAASLTGLELFHEPFDLPRFGVLHTEVPHYWRRGRDGESEDEFSARCAEELDALIQAEGPDTVAAFFAEPVMGTGGIIPPPRGYWRAIKSVLDRHDVLLVADEVITAFGRLGSWFGSERYGIQPDLITIAKGLTSGYLPLSGVIVSEQIWQVLEEGSAKYGPFAHGWTYSAHPMCAAAANANLDIVEREKLVENAHTVGGFLRASLSEALADHPNVGEVRGDGMLCAVEFVADQTCRRSFNVADRVGPRISAACLDRGLIARAMPHGDILGLAPPLVLTRQEAEEIIERTVSAVLAVLPR